MVGNGVEFYHQFIEVLLFLEDRHDNHLDRRQVRRQDESVIIGVGHDERTHQTGRDTPTRSPYILVFILFIEELYVEGLGEVLTEEMGGTGLQGLTVLHHSLNTIRIECSGEALVRRLDTFDDRNSHYVLRKVRIDIEHLSCVVLGFLFGSMGGVSLLPEELSRTQEKTRTHLPTHDVTPLVTEDRQVAIGRDPVLIGGPDDGLGGRTDDEFFLEFRLRVYDHAATVGIVHQTMVGHNGALFGKALYVLRFAAKERLRDEEREIGVFDTFLFEPTVELRLNLFPDRIAVGLDDHTAADRTLLRQVGLNDQFVIPLRVILASRS